ncbi:alpha-1,2 glucosyltransferas-like protein alg10 [Lojkania enalia]|uniref:Dol-P-Glc:Glc(2)Man(9)GlcNAc(2)-PP-Dol alpha-1,2-glucosyltransferase n=1 Tax=Lojkania enalia TaxID=147567 RepID=A0A9P4N9S8_9PLEO|nr:alpha-1,2 glucosyltransferas-like protein alg10 [Didymosphaeria enalia]
MPSSIQTWALPIAVIAIANIAGTWYKLVSDNVPDPYLDEIFHVPQAQRYCNRDWRWDPKITTPPGLYVVSLLLSPIFGDCDTSPLRALNTGAICVVCVLAYDIMQTLRFRNLPNEVGAKQTVVPQKPAVDDQGILFDAHSALNISLFPPLFFFSGLYYTDVMSTLFVLVSYSTFLKRGKERPSIWQDATFILIGMMALSFRQTNIFWVAVFPAGLAVVEMLKQEAAQSANAASSDMLGILNQSWVDGKVHDCDIGSSSLRDCILFLLSIALAILSKPVLILRVSIPYIMLLSIFACFVAWNGGVVLGDKSNHIATIHFPQMLYIWPYLVFFSLPVTIAPFLRLIAYRLPEGRIKKFATENLIGLSTNLTPGLLSTILFLVLGVAATHFNTIVHPFTLADNRHYVFYVFRILRRHPAIKYLAVPAYYSCSWMAIQALASPSENIVEDRPSRGSGAPTINKVGRKPCQLSFVMVWLVTTALSVVSAPLVEPRYFIIPWIIWRLHVPSILASPSLTQPARKWLLDIRLLLETAWLLFINGLTGYTFLYRGFYWASEPGKLQRFLY